MTRAWLGLFLLLAACGAPSERNASAPLDPPLDLETAARERGLVQDPDDIDVTGIYARDTDRLCVVPQGGAYRLGAFVDYGNRNGCSGAGRATRVGETLHIDFDTRGKGSGCSFDARYDGDSVRFPGQLPEGCSTLCQGRASFAALGATRLSDSEAEASALRDLKGRTLCRQTD